MSSNFEHPGDRRRFVFYARERNINFEIAEPSKTYDVVIVSQQADLSVWNRSNVTGGKVVYDSVDSYLAISKFNVKGRLRGLAKYLAGQSRYLRFNYWNTVRLMCSRADAVICSTKEQEVDISNFSSNVHIILDAQRDSIRRIKTSYVAHRPFRLVWEGLPQNLNTLKLLSPVLANLSQKHPIELHVVTDAIFNRYLGRYAQVSSRKVVSQIFSPWIFHEWDQETFSEIICECDLAVIPLDLSDKFASGKPENKLLLFWQIGMPVITSATPAYLRAMTSAGLDYAVNERKEWIEKLSRLISSESAREQVGLLGKSYAYGQHSIDRLLKQWDAVFESIGFSVSKI